MSYGLASASYALALDRLYALAAELAPTPARLPRRKFDLDQMRRLLAALGHPEQQFRSLLITGTNGKGSTAAMLASILQAAGHRTALYTSPHLTRVNERIQIDGAPISDHDFARLFFQVEEAGARLVVDRKLPQPPSFFETVTALAFLHFASQTIDIAVLEVGMGGRLDATNTVEPLLSVITDISLDHTEWLGTTIAAIAREKAGILRPHGTLVTLPQHPEANQAIGEIAVSLQVTGINAAQYMPAAPAVSRGFLQGVTYPVLIDQEPCEITLPLPGEHQFRNAALAIAAAIELRNHHGYNIADAAIQQGIRNTRWPGRLELFPANSSRPATLLDAAHNPAGAWTLRSALNTADAPSLGVPTDRSSSVGWSPKRTLLFGCLQDKAYTEMAQILFPIFDRIILSPIDSPRAVDPKQLLSLAQQLGVPAVIAESPQASLSAAFAATLPDGLVVCAGSIYLVGSLRPQLAGEPSA